MTIKLSESQARNLSRLAEVGTFTFTDSVRLESPRRNNSWERTCGYRMITSQKGDHKGFHIVALDSLVGKGIVTCKTVTTSTMKKADDFSGSSNRANIGNHSTTKHIYTIASAAPAPKATGTMAALVALLSTGKSLITVDEMQAAGVPASGQKYAAYWRSQSNTGAKAAAAAGVTVSLRTVDGQKVLRIG